MRLSSVFRQFLLFLSLLALECSPAAATEKPTIVTPFDPCYSYTILDQSWRSIYNTTMYPYLNCDYNFNFVGWYRFLLNGQNAQMTEQCIPVNHCGSYASLHLDGGHPTIADGVVNRNSCVLWNNVCCSVEIIPIRVKACLGGYYVYELVQPTPYCSAYCAEVNSFTTLTEPGIFYSYASTAESSINAPSDDGSSSSVQPPTPFLFFGNKYQQIYVNNNGFLTFSQSSSQYDPDSFPAFKNQDTIAGLWTDLDNREKGLVYYRQYTNGSILQRATQDINSYFSNLTFNASWVFTATWNKVAYYNLTSTDTSFQVVLISGGNYSFILMNYAGIAATDHPVEAGYDTVNSNYYFVIPGSNSGSSITNLNSSSNVNVPGRWAFRVDGGPKPIAAPPFDPCYSYTILDQSWRSVYNTTFYPYLNCDYNFNFVGWYRFLLDGQNAQMTEQCIPVYHCGSYVSLHLDGGHPTIADGVVNRKTCVFWNNICCNAEIIPIRVKACLGGYYVYELVQPTPYCSAYCAEVSSFTTLAEPGIFYSYGPMVENTINAPSDDGSSSSVQLPTPFLFFGNKHQQIYVNNNGFLTFSQSSSQYDPDSFPAFKNQDIIAGLWTDLDNREKGQIYYRQYTNGSILQKATQDINSYFSNLNFNASWVFTATWNKVAYYNPTSTETSFQVVLISGGNYSFILMNYAGIAATEHPVEAGYDTVNSSNYFVIPGSNNGSSITKLNTSSNVNVPGRWAFRVDGESKPIAENTIGLQMKLLSYLDITNMGHEDILEKVRQNLIKKGLPDNIQMKLRKLQKIKP